MPSLGLSLLLLLVSGDAFAQSVSLEEIKELYVKGFYFPTGTVFQGVTTWTETQQGYVLRTPARLYFYSRSLDMIQSIRMGEDDTKGAIYATTVNDSLFYVLEARRISVFSLEGKIIRQWLYPSNLMRGNSLVARGSRIVIAGYRNDLTTDGPVPTICMYDTLLEPPLFYDDFFSDSLLSLLRKKITVSVMCAKTSNGFAAVCSSSPEIFLFTSDGKIQDVIKETSPFYKGALKTPPDSTWDYVNFYYGIATVNDSFLLVPRKTRSNPYYLDIYNLNSKKFVERIECNTPIIGASSGNLFFADSLTENYAKISVYKIVPADSKNKIPDSLRNVAVCKKCGQPISRYEYVSCLDTVKTVPAGRKRTAFVLPFPSFEPDSLRKFCSKTKKNMFVFAAPDPMGGVLIDTVSRSVRGRQDWHLITVICSCEPEKLGLYLSGLDGDIILINQNEAIPDSTMALSDLGLPPVALAFDKGGKRFIAGYSLAPNYDEDKKTRFSALTFGDFLQKCEITE